MVSESDLADRLRTLLRTSDLSITTATTVRRALEEEFDLDLSDRKAFIRRQIEFFLEGRKDDGAENDGVVASPKEEIQEEGAENVTRDDDEKSAEEGDGVDASAKGEIEEEEAENVTRDDDEKSAEEGDGEGEEVQESGGKRTRKRRSDKVANAVKKRAGGFMKPSGLSPQLQTFVGVSELARPEVVKRIWAYIREKNLQDPKNKRKVLCDEALCAIFRVKSIDMFRMSKALSKHMWPLNEEDVSVESSQKKKRHKRGREGSNR